MALAEIQGENGASICPLACTQVIAIIEGCEFTAIHVMIAMLVMAACTEMHTQLLVCNVQGCVLNILHVGCAFRTCRERKTWHVYSNR